MKGYYYLHTDGDLIYKNALIVDSDPAYFDSPFVKKYWFFDSEQRFDAWHICIEALALGAKKKRVFELKEKWGLTDEDGKKFAEVAKLKIFKDGDKFCAAFDDFIDIPESQCGFGDTALETFAELARGGLMG
ncbi:unnamed protein product [marine sediment metagenome]|uniref:Uncharacterized protein n=1 Tax=marine sediment metagenome TaxID=412755 RepID=X0Z0J8_9ZZZZ